MLASRSDFDCFISSVESFAVLLGVFVPVYKTSSFEVDGSVAAPAFLRGLVLFFCSDINGDGARQTNTGANFGKSRR